VRLLQTTDKRREIMRSNENKMSCGERESAAQQGKETKS